MATVTDPNIDAVSTSNVTSYGNAEFAPDLAFTPAVDDLIVVCVTTSGSVEPTASGALTDDQSGTYTKAITSLRTGSASSNYIFVRNQAVASAVLHTLTFTCTGDAATGAAAVPLRVAGMSKYGATAVKQTAFTSNIGAGGTPAATFGTAVLTGNVVIGMVGASTNPVTVTEPTSYTEAADVGYATPAAGIEVVFRNSGETGTTITWGSTTVGTSGVCIVELDTSAAATTMPPKPVVVTFAVKRASSW
jgi:hypothetical protein